MKKLFFVATVFGALALTSCKKDYTCDCTFDSDFVGAAESTSINGQKKKDAEEACDKLQEGWSILGANCELNKK